MSVTTDSAALQKRLGESLTKAAIATLLAFRNAKDLSELDKLRALRLELALLCLEIPEESLQAASAPLSEMRKAVAGVGLLDLPRTIQENILLDRIRSVIGDRIFGDPVTGAVLAGMLLAQSFEIPLVSDFERCPAWLLDRYVEFLFERPTLFHKVGDLPAYVAFQEALVNRLWENVQRHPDSVLWARIHNTFLWKNSLLQAYFVDRNLRHLFIRRAKLVERGLETLGCSLDHLFARRPAMPDRIKLGIVTPELTAAPENFHTLAYLEHLDRNIFEVNLYSPGKTGQAFEDHFRGLSDHFVELPTDLRTLVSRIRADDLDIMLIGSNVTAVTNLAAATAVHRLARVQIALMHSPITTGFRNIDLMLSAEWNEPAEAEQQYKERLCLVEGSVNCYAYQYDRDQPSFTISRADLHCPPKSLLFFSGANFFKIVPELFETWAKVLAAVPESTLVLMPFNPNWSNQYSNLAFMMRLETQLAAYGIKPDRLRVLNSLPTRADVHNVIRACDVYLDSYPFSGACSLVDAIAVGLPIVAWKGSTTRSRHSFSILGTMGLESLVASSEEEYIRMAVEFGTNPAAREQARAAIQAAMEITPPVLDTKSFGDRVGRALRTEFERYVRGCQELLEDADNRLTRTIENASQTFAFRALEDVYITQQLVQPYLRGRLDGKPGHIVDVGACYGQISATFLREGWTAELFEPDSGAREVLKSQMAPFAGRFRVFPYAVSDRADPAIPFHRAAQHGLSGLNPATYSQTQEISTVRCIRLGDFLAEQGTARVDFLKVDTEGYDFDVLAGYDFERLRPSIVFIEFGSERQRPRLRSVLDEMHLRGYSALLFHYTDDGNFRKNIWQTRLVSVLPGERVGELPGDAFGNILFYLTEDRLFPMAAADLFASFVRGN